MTKKTKILAGILATVLLAGATTTVVCLSRDKEPSSQGQVSVQPNDSADNVTDENGEVLSEGVNVMPARMTFRSARAITGESKSNSATIQANIKPDKVSHISFLEISKSDDGGETWIALTEDDYGKVITVDTLKYNFRTSGMYRVTIMDEFRTGIDALVQTISYEQPMPEATLDGVEHEGYTNKPVTFTWKDEAIVEVLKDGKVIEYTSGQKLTEDGFYKITFL